MLDDDKHLFPPYYLVPVVRQDALAKNPDASVEVLPGLNHLLQPAKTGLPEEYGGIETTISPVALDVIGGWLQEHLVPK